MQEQDVFVPTLANWEHFTISILADSMPLSAHLVARIV